MEIRQLIRGITLFLLLIGFGTLIEAVHLPEWTDEARAHEILGRSYPGFDTREEQLAYSTAWHRDISELRTMKWLYANIGSGFLALAASLFAGTHLLRIQDWRGAIGLRTPSKRWQIAVIVCVSWSGLLAGETLRLFQEYDRRYFPWWADTLAIPLTGIVLLGIIGLALLLPALGLGLWRAQLPAPFWAWRADAPIRDLLITAPAALAALAVGCFTAALFAYAHWLQAPAALLWLYAMLVFRAAALSGIRVKENG